MAAKTPIGVLLARSRLALAAAARLALRALDAEEEAQRVTNCDGSAGAIIRANATADRLRKEARVALRAAIKMYNDRTTSTKDE